jgi:tRNA G26 N,N-dimethylase Trm1
MSTKSQIALLYEIELKRIVESATLSNSEKVKQLINFKPEPVWNQENKKYEYVRECGPIREKVKMYKPKYLEKLRDNDSRKTSLTEDEKSMIEHKIEVEKMLKLDCPNSKNGFIISLNLYKKIFLLTKNFLDNKVPINQPKNININKKILILIFSP